MTYEHNSIACIFEQKMCEKLANLHLRTALSGFAYIIINPLIVIKYKQNMPIYVDY